MFAAVTLPLWSEDGSMEGRHATRDLRSMNQRVHIAKHLHWRTTAMLLLALLLATLFAPAIGAAAAGDEASLPACCRAHGRHHCAMGRAATRAGNDEPGVARWTERCPCPACAPAASHGGTDGVAASALAYAELASHPGTHPQVEAHRRIALDPANRKRGPPTDTFFA